MNNLVCTVRITFHVSRLNQSHMRQKTFLAALNAINFAYSLSLTLIDTKTQKLMNLVVK